ncbi:MAG: hypothetical protein IJC04_08045 [Oscillospiraceae bacterium]|nr:hypothetical protein [Oscillospiraceae bacterium]
MKKTFTIMCLCALMLCGCASEPQAAEMETFIMEDTYTIGTTGPEFKEIEETLTEETTVVLAQETTAESVQETTAEQMTDTTAATTKNPYIEYVEGFYINIASPYEQWHFYDDGRFHFAGQELTYDVQEKDYQIRLIISDGREYDVLAGYDDSLTLVSDDGEMVELYEEGSEQVMEAREKRRLYVENADLFDKFPDESGWMEDCDYGDIPYLADADYIEKSLTEGIFLVSTPEELASFNYYVNTSPFGELLLMQLQNDIDLSGYRWTPMGWYGGKFDCPFISMVDGNGYSIKNMMIDYHSGSVGFIGWETGCAVYNITFENASVSGSSMVGIITGQAIGGYYENCHVNGEVNGSSAGAMIGHAATDRLIDCTADVIVNGEQFDFLTWNDKEKSEIVIENPVEITIDDTYTVTRPEVEGYTNLGWLIEKDGLQVLHRNAENELSYQYFVRDPGVYTICLTAWVDGQYVPISNIIEYTIY